MVVCRKCGVELVVGANWLPSRAARNERSCSPCKADQERAYRAKTADRQKARQAAYYEANKARASERDKAYRQANLAKEKVRRAAYYEANKADHRARDALRRATLKSQTPSDADRAKIAAIYAMAERLTRLTGQPYHVDHIQSLASGGLHHQDNLVVMIAPVNLAKGAQSWPWLEWFNQPPL